MADGEAAEDVFSNVGASGDEEIFQAYSSYRESRQKLRDIQKNRGFKPKEPGATDERKQAIAKEKSRSRCAACGRLGYWAGDPQCGKRSASGPGKSKGKKGSGKSKKEASLLHGGCDARVLHRARRWR